MAIVVVAAPRPQRDRDGVQIELDPAVSVAPSDVQPRGHANPGGHGSSKHDPDHHAIHPATPPSRAGQAPGLPPPPPASIRRPPLRPASARRVGSTPQHAMGRVHPGCTPGVIHATPIPQLFARQRDGAGLERRAQPLSIGADVGGVRRSRFTRASETAIPRHRFLQPAPNRAPNGAFSPSELRDLQGK
jgi:hypothetical protein